MLQEKQYSTGWKPSPLLNLLFLTSKKPLQQRALGPTFILHTPFLKQNEQYYGLQYQTSAQSSPPKQRGR